MDNKIFKSCYVLFNKKIKIRIYFLLMVYLISIEYYEYKIELSSYKGIKIVDLNYYSMIGSKNW